MKIKIKQLLSNPFRGEYPFDQKKVESLKSSMRTTGVWDNLILRRHPENSDEYEIAYGHHRLEALRQLILNGLIDWDYELELPVRKLDDSAMIRIMVSENPINKAAVEVVLKYIVKECKVTVDEIDADDICRFVGADWTRVRVSGILKKIKAK